MADPNSPTPVMQLAATGTGECRDKDGNLLDNNGNIVGQPSEKDEI